MAVRVISDVIDRHRTFDEAWSAAEAADVSGMMSDSSGILPRDRAFARLLAATVLRRHGELAKVIATFIPRPLPEKRGRLSPILLAAAAQLLVLDTPAHAAISMAVDQCRADPHARHFGGLANAVLRRVSTEGPAILATLDPVRLNIPDWLFNRWRAAYGDDKARLIAMRSLAPAPLDLSVKADAAGWAEKLAGRLLPTGSIRLASGGRIEDLAGFAEGAWWVQDAAAALPARLLGRVDGLRIADLCAAPGGKTAELASAGARLAAVEQSPARAERLAANLKRLGLASQVTVSVADASQWSAGAEFDAVILDAPCTATGTIRRHPDILHLKRSSDIATLAALQSKLLDNAARLVAPGGLLVYCTCSLEPEECEQQIGAFLARDSRFVREPVAPGEHGIEAAWITAEGDLRTLPFHLETEDPAMSGLDGFFAARLRRKPAAPAPQT